MNILFICKFNRFRSKIAESFFNKLNKNKKHKAKSAGMMKGIPTSKEVIESASDFGIKIESKPKKLSAKLLEWQDLLIIVANNVLEKDLQARIGKRPIIWKISDTSSHNREGIKKRISQIEKRVKALLEEID